MNKIILPGSFRERTKYKYKKTGNIAIDAVDALINHYAGMYIQTIYLCKSYYDLFQDHVKRQMQRQQKVNESDEKIKFSYKGIPIETRTMTAKIQWVFADNKTGEA